MEPQNNLFELENTSLDNSFSPLSHITIVLATVIQIFLEFLANRRCNLTKDTTDRKPHIFYRTR